MATQSRVWIEDNHARSSVITWVPVPIEKVFAYISEFNRHTEWGRNEITVTPLSSAPMGVGSRYKSVAKQAGQDWPSDLEVTGYEPPHRFEFTATGGPMDAPVGDPHRHEFLLTPENGGTRIELRRSDPKPPNWSTWLWALLKHPFVRASLYRRVETVENLRNELERQRI
jgi:uncharacterized protein YndB with AHSA1/START domain